MGGGQLLLGPSADSKADPSLIKRAPELHLKVTFTTPPPIPTPLTNAEYDSPHHLKGRHSLFWHEKSHQFIASDLADIHMIPVYFQFPIRPPRSYFGNPVLTPSRARARAPITPITSGATKYYDGSPRFKFPGRSREPSLGAGTFQESAAQLAESAAASLAPGAVTVFTYHVILSHLPCIVFRCHSK